MTAFRFSTVASQFGWVSGGRLLAALVQALVVVLLARAISPQEFGLFAATQGALIVAQTVSGLGLATYVVRHRAIRTDDPNVLVALRLNEATTYAFGGVLLAAFISLGAWIDEAFFALLPLALSMAAERSADAWLGVAIADGDARVNTLNLVGRRIATAAIFLALTTGAGAPPLLSFGIAALFAAVASWIFSRMYVGAHVARRRFEGPRRRRYAVVLRRSRHYWMNSIATQLRNLDTTVAAFSMSPAQAGFFGVASRVTGPLRMLPTSLSIVLLPVASRTGSKDRRSLALLIAGAASGITILFVSVAIVAPYVVPALLGNDYRGATVTLQLTAIGLIPAGIASLLGAVLQGSGHARYVSNVAFIMTGVCLAGVALGGASLGAVGGAIALGVAYIVQMALLIIRYITLNFEPQEKE
ncbi:lipopolysaccharide biosynthesis protein [Microbacterium luteum]|uniref:lipopolysaccharide biosynthesis protein n=1 Tax=Microbacterium luteum TaxID=2782167 RepID=UPI00188764D2|nr:lipopolysaccharide biosynthesis protein [Microbacterium luteum]